MMNTSYIDDSVSKPERHSTPSYHSSDVNRLKKFNFDQKQLTIPNFTNLIKKTIRDKAETPTTMTYATSEMNTQIATLLSQKKARHTHLILSNGYRGYSSNRR